MQVSRQWTQRVACPAPVPWNRMAALEQEAWSDITPRLLFSSVALGATGRSGRDSEVGPSVVEVGPWLRSNAVRPPPPQRSDLGKGHTHTHLHGAGREPEVGPAAVRSDPGCDPWAVRPPCPPRSDRGPGRSSAGRAPEVGLACVEGGNLDGGPGRSDLCAPRRFGPGKLYRLR